LEQAEPLEGEFSGKAGKLNLAFNHLITEQG
jgi:hypothetical protein